MDNKIIIVVINYFTAFRSVNVFVVHGSHLGCAFELLKAVHSSYYPAMTTCNKAFNFSAYLCFLIYKA